MGWRKEGASYHHQSWSQFLVGFIRPVWWHPPDDGRQCMVVAVTSLQHRLVSIKAILLCEFFSSIFILATQCGCAGGEQGGAQTSKKTWVLRGDQDGGSSGHLLCRRRKQVREKATGDLQTIFRETFPQVFTQIVKVKVFLPHSLLLYFIMFSS